MSYPRYKGSKNQTKNNPSPTTSTPPTVSSPQNKPATPTPASPPQPNSNASNQSATIDWLTEKIAVETRARENEAKLNKRVAELESENDKLLTENQRLQLEAYEVVAIDNTSNNNDDVRLEELLNEIKTLKETCQQHLEDIAQLDHQNATLLQEKVVSGQHVQRLDTHVQILAENLGLKETETARLVDQFNKVAAENSQLQEENSSLEKENHRLQENLLFQPTTQREEINELKLQIEQLTDENIRLQEENEYILSNYKQLGDEVVKLREENDQLMSDNAILDGEITRLQDENAQLISVNNNCAADISKLQQENGQILSTKNSLVEETSKLQEDNTQILSDSNSMAAEISKLQEANAQILSDKNHLASEISKLQEENAQILSNNNSFTAEISKLQEENAQTLSIKNRFAEQTFKLQEDNAQIISENNNLVEEITKLREGNANFEKLQGENAQLLSNNTRLSDANGELIHQNKQLDSENQHLQNQVIQLEQRLKEEMDPFQQKLLTEPNILNTTKNFKNLNLHEIRPILVQFKDVNSNITAELQNDLGRLQKLLETFGSVKGAGKEINIDQVIPLWHEYLDTSFQTKTMPKNTLSAALTRHIIETIFDGMANGIQDLEMTDNQDLEFRILTATDTLTDLILHFCAAREIDQDTATALPSKIRQLVCSFVNKFGFKENEHPFVKSLAARVQQQADRYRTLKKPSTNVEKLVRLAISVFYLQMRPLGVREVTFIETSNEYNESTMDDGDDNENADEVEICWFPLILAEEPFEAQTLVTKAKVVYREPSKEAGVGKQSEGDIVYGRQWPLEIWAP